MTQKKPLLSLIIFILSFHCIALEREFVAHPFYQFDLEGHLSSSVNLTDIDADGDIDIILTNGRHWPQPNYLFFNDGKGRMLIAEQLGKQHKASYHSQVVDLNQDGRKDILVFNDKLPIEIYLQNQNGFPEQPNVLVGSNGNNVRSSALGDLNADGLLDIVLARRNQPNVFHLQTVDGLFSEARAFTTEKLATTGVVVTDVNNDGNQDVIFSNRGGSPVLMLGNGDATFNKIDLPVSGDLRDVAVADLNQDGKPDIVFASLSGANPLLLGADDGQYLLCETLGDKDIQSAAVTIADIDQDGLLDIIFGNEEKPSTLFRQTGDCLFSEMQIDAVNADVYDVQAADLNSDGFPELVFAVSGDSNIIVLNRLTKKQ